MFLFMIKFALAFTFGLSDGCIMQRRNCIMNQFIKITLLKKGLYVS